MTQTIFGLSAVTVVCLDLWCLTCQCWSTVSEAAACSLLNTHDSLDDDDDNLFIYLFNIRAVITEDIAVQ